MTKQIRILTGCHAGARLNLRHGTWSLGDHPDADIQISDWEAEQMILDYREDGTVMFGAAQAAGGATRLAERLHDLLPRRCGDIALCVGPADAHWPSDMELLQAMLAEAPRAPAAPKDDIDATALPARAPKRFSKRMVRTGACAATVAGMIGFTLLLTTGQSGKADAAIRPAGMTPAERQRNKVEVALRRLHQPDLHAERSDGHVVVSGIVPTAADALATTRALRQLSSDDDAVEVETHFAVADSVADDLRSSLGEDGITVRYLGGGAFAVSGVTRDLTRTRATLARARTDYGTAIRRIDDTLTQNALPPQNVNAMLDSDDVRYVQLQDGTKSFAAEPSSPPGPPPVTSADLSQQDD
ncbi:hypothetical protein OVY01_07375 [Robbsia sp. Bb-Pol-6]|uniref:Uncharacterized protein n=1 Tax=Robbsia betulipollinis TaxID=2981849 RepID=A0ABT3ZKJ1_9BURK|nr:hypothetical protein [Robbsia betulipollinis]MCY0387056.1 hypothetical protein [Robbsia betulipollinis]